MSTTSNYVSVLWAQESLKIHFFSLSKVASQLSNYLSKIEAATILIKLPHPTNTQLTASGCGEHKNG
ncbi:MAG: hypothetical protein V7K97_15390 [Nostoc sp.]|uniref:hypothetical protein n=1 Tax=Nostoc sp. TaxID=1180 RepID=UPI002FF4A33D